MNFQEFKAKLEILFNNLLPEFQYTNYDMIDNYFLDANKNFKIITIADDDDDVFYYYILKLPDISHDDLVYSSPKYDNYEQFYDELIIFKELILPKYL